MIGVGGMQLYKAETTGPMKDSKLTPRITETAKALWVIYVGLTVLCMLSYWACGMSFFDALCYAFSTISTGGYAPHNASIAYYPYVSVYVVSMIFMLLGGINFSLHFLAFRRFQFKAYWRNIEFRYYMYFLGVVSVIMSGVLIWGGTEKNAGHAILNAFYQVISFSTTTGFVSDGSFMHWPLFLPVFLVLIGVIGACAGSTTGGIKIIRVMLFQLQISREIKRLIHPAGEFPIKLGTQVVPDRVMSGVWSFLSAYVFIFVIFWLILMATGLDPVTAFTALAACLSNAGPGLGSVVANYGTTNDFARWLLSIAMMFGRLEVFTVLVLLSPAFWRR
jgi:trk system potassium uptake protein TrkH